jgi:hypothetical protein
MRMLRQVVCALDGVCDDSQDSANNVFFEVPPGTGVGLPLFLDRAEEPCANLQLSYFPARSLPWNLPRGADCAAFPCVDHAGSTVVIARSAPGLNGESAHRHAVLVELKSGIETSSSRQSDPESLARARAS